MVMIKLNYRPSACAIVLVIACFNLSLPGLSQNKKICISIDDLPAVIYGDKDPNVKSKIVQQLIVTLTHQHIPAIGFVNEGKLYEGQQLIDDRVNLLTSWVENGFDLGNHTYSHLDFNHTNNKVYFDDILKGQSITKAILEKHGKTLKYFRHPYLHRGENAAKNHALNTFLSQHNYREAPVTIDNDEYLFAKAYHLAFFDGDKKQMEWIGKEYIRYMEAKVHYFENISHEIFGRSIGQSLLLHANLLNADYLDKLAAMLKSHGYEFVSQEEVLRDDAYASPINTFSSKGISWLFLWAMSKGINKNIMLGDIEPPKAIVALANQ